jgi:hypothetical protein
MSCVIREPGRRGRRALDVGHCVSDITKAPRRRRLGARGAGAASFAMQPRPRLRREPLLPIGAKGQGMRSSPCGSAPIGGCPGRRWRRGGSDRTRRPIDWVRLSARDRAEFLHPLPVSRKRERGVRLRTRAARVHLIATRFSIRKTHMVERHQIGDSMPPPLDGGTKRASGRAASSAAGYLAARLRSGRVSARPAAVPSRNAHRPSGRFPAGHGVHRSDSASAPRPSVDGSGNPP